VDGVSLIFFHFHQFRQLAPFVWDTNNRANGVGRRAFLYGLLYRPYIQALTRAHALGDRVGVRREKQLIRKHFSAGRLGKIVRSLLGGDAVIG
jgi:hypothetical protein